MGGAGTSTKHQCLNYPLLYAKTDRNSGSLDGSQKLRLQLLLCWDILLDLLISLGRKKSVGCHGRTGCMLTHGL